MAVLAHPGGRGRRQATRTRLRLLVALGLTLLVVPALAAQSRGSLQVAARVVETRPHREALLEARVLLAAAGGSPALAPGRRTALASVQSEALFAEGRRREGWLVTVSFLRN